MNFEYKKYYKSDYQKPLLVILFSGLIIIAQVVFHISHILNHIKYMGFDIIIAIPFAYVSIYFFVAASVPFFRNGRYLQFEKEKDAVWITGIVEKIIEMDGFYWPHKYIEYDHINGGRGEAIIISGQVYFIMSCGDIQTGDPVTMEVLPKSRIVLQLDYKPDAPQAAP